MTRLLYSTKGSNISTQNLATICPKIYISSTQHQRRERKNKNDPKRVENSCKSVMLFHRGRSAAVNRGTVATCREVNTCAPESAVITCFSGSHRKNPHDSTSLIKYPKRRRKGNYLIVLHSKYMWMNTKGMKRGMEMQENDRPIWCPTYMLVIPFKILFPKL